MEIKTILQNDTVKNILTKAGISNDKMEIIAKQAFEVIQNKFEKNPSQMTSLMSGHPKSETDTMMEAEIESDFVQNLVQKVGIPENIAHQVKEILPNVMNQFNGSFSNLGIQGTPNKMEGLKNIFQDKK